MNDNPNVSMGSGSFDFDAQNSGGNYGDPPSGGNFGGGFGGDNRSGGDSSGGKRRGMGCGLIIGLVVLVFVIGGFVRGCSSSSAAANCGDYDLVDGQYVSNPDRGDYVKNGSSYDYVGCSNGSSTQHRSGGIWIFPFFTGGSGTSGSNYGDGSGFRGGGPGSGK